GVEGCCASRDPDAGRDACLCSPGSLLRVHAMDVSIDYFDEAGTEPSPDMTDPEKSKTYVVATYTNKKIQFSGITLYTDEFPSKLRTMARSLIMEKSVSSQADKTESTETHTHHDINFSSTISDVFYETRSVISTIEPDPIKDIIAEAKSRAESRDLTPDERSNQPDPILFAKLVGHQELAFKIKHTEEVEGPKVEIRVLLGSFIVFLSPRQLHTLVELVDALNQPDLEDTSNIPMRSSGMNIHCKPMKQADFQLIEAQLLGNLEHQTSKPTGKHGWSGPSFEDSDMESERFHPMTSNNQMTESFTSSVSSMNTSMTSSCRILMETQQLRCPTSVFVLHHCLAYYCIRVKCSPFYLDVELTLMERMSALFFGRVASSSSPPLKPEPCFAPAAANPMTTSMYMMSSLRSAQPGPFSGKKCAHQSVTKHESTPQQRLGTHRPAPEKIDTHNFCLTFKVGKGLLSIYAPVR
ncbi:putative autophagy-related protein 2-like protein, partial [Operophtera brumata]